MRSLLPILALCLLSLPVTVIAADPPASPVIAQAATTESALTRVLVLMDARLKLAPDVARYKWNTRGAIEDQVREDRIIATLGQQAAQIIAAKIKQYWATAEHHPAVAELASALLIAACP